MSSTPISTRQPARRPGTWAMALDLVKGTGLALLVAAAGATLATVAVWALCRDIGEGGIIYVLLVAIFVLPALLAVAVAVGTRTTMRGMRAHGATSLTAAAGGAVQTALLVGAVWATAVTSDVFPDISRPLVLVPLAAGVGTTLLLTASGSIRHAQRAAGAPAR